MEKTIYRLIAIDLDGTLLSPTGEVTPRAKEAVHAALRAGLLVCFATGRSWTESRTILETVEHFDTAVFVGGAMVIDTGKDVTLHRTLMQPELARELCRYLEAQGQAVLALQETSRAGFDYLITEDAPLNEATRQWMTATSAVIHRVPSLGDWPHEHTMRISYIAAPEEVTRIESELRRDYGERIVMNNHKVPSQRVELLEIFDPAVNKWQGVLHVARRHGVRPEQIVAIGDDVNDVPMIQNAGLGVAMGNARPEVQAVAKLIIRPNAEEGLARFIEELVAEHLVEPADDADDAAA